jgi:hypothetical protein
MDYKFGPPYVLEFRRLSGGAYPTPVPVFTSDNYFYLMDVAGSHGYTWAAVCTYYDLLFSRAAWDNVWSPPLHLGAPAYDCELVELRWTTGIVYCSTDAENSIWFDQLDSGL